MVYDNLSLPEIQHQCSYTDIENEVCICNHIGQRAMRRNYLSMLKSKINSGLCSKLSLNFSLFPGPHDGEDFIIINGCYGNHDTINPGRPSSCHTSPGIPGSSGRCEKSSSAYDHQEHI